MKNIYTREEYEALRRRCDTYAEANLEQQKTLEKLRDEVAYFRTENDRLKAELSAMHNTMQIVVGDNNTRYQKQNDEVDRLRRRLKDHGIAPGD